MTALRETSRGRARRRGFTPLSLLTEAWLPIALVAAWWFASAASTSSFFPPLSRILETTWNKWVLGGGIVRDLLPSLGNFAIGFALAVVVGVALGTFIGLRPRLRDAIEPELEFARAVPAVAILPVAMLALGLGDDMRIAVITFGAVWPVLLNTIDGVRSVDTTLRDVSTSFLLPWSTRTFLVRLAAASPQIMAGARTALSVSIIMIVVSEMSGAHRGIGFTLLTSQRNYAVTDMWAAMVVLGIVGYLMNLIFRLVETRMLHWHPAYRRGR